jgi:hypothetical protein
MFNAAAEIFAFLGMEADLPEGISKIKDHPFHALAI